MHNVGSRYVRISSDEFLSLVAYVYLRYLKLLAAGAHTNTSTNIDVYTTVHAVAASSSL